MPDVNWTGPTVGDVIRDLNAKIDGGIWQNGDRLPPERELATQYGLARNTLRRALKTLEGDGRLIRHVGRGTFVQAPQAPAPGDLARRMRDASPEDLMEMRLIMEPEAAALATARATAGELREIETIYRGSLAVKGIAEFELWDSHLHVAICRAARNVLILDYCTAIDAARNQPRWHRLKQRAVTPEFRALYNRHHGDIVVALTERDANAARHAVHHHLSMVRDHLLGVQR